jgi:hypothetical protein
MARRPRPGYQDGVLKVKIPRPAAAEGRKIKVRAEWPWRDDGGD